MSSCKVKKGWRVADSLELCWYTTDLHAGGDTHTQTEKGVTPFGTGLVMFSVTKQHCYALTSIQNGNLAATEKPFRARSQISSSVTKNKKGMIISTEYEIVPPSEN